MNLIGYSKEIMQLKTISGTCDKNTFLYDSFLKLQYWQINYLL